jgi:ClpX C4-type zinc finger
MAVDEELLAAARAAQARVVESERAVELARAEFRYGVRKLHLAGASLREIGDALNLSHQRVHQLVEEAEGGARGWRSFTGRPGPLGARGDRPKRGELACSFCGKIQKEVGKLIAGPNFVAICDTCTGKASQVLETGRVAATPLSAIRPAPSATDGPAGPEAVAKCSFCGKGRHQVIGLAVAAGTTTAGVTVCDECLALCREIIADG